VYSSAPVSKPKKVKPFPVKKQPSELNNTWRLAADLLLESAIATFRSFIYQEFVGKYLLEETLVIRMPEDPLEAQLSVTNLVTKEKNRTLQAIFSILGNSLASTKLTKYILRIIDEFVKYKKSDQTVMVDRHAKLLDGDVLIKTTLFFNHKDKKVRHRSMLLFREILESLDNEVHINTFVTILVNIDSNGFFKSLQTLLSVARKDLNEVDDLAKIIGILCDLTKRSETFQELLLSDKHAVIREIAMALKARGVFLGGFLMDCESPHLD